MSRNLQRSSISSFSNGRMGGEESSQNIKVCVRVRPFIKEEYARDNGKPELCLSMPSMRSVELTKGEVSRCFDFDRAYWSFNDDHPNFADQRIIYQELGETLLTHAIDGFNNCIFAYGQTASGKSFSVLGSKEGDGQGLLPRIVQGLFEHFAALPQGTTCKCSVSFIEIYNEQIRDLLMPSQGRGQRQLDHKLEVRQHPVLGVIVPGLTEAATGSCKEVLDLIDYGCTIRTVGETAMNQSSSRSHCMFTFKTTIVSPSGQARMSQTHLVDLAGSERSKRTGATGERLREGAAINKSLSTLARVIFALSSGDRRPPFRDSKLTFFLKESVSGNSKTVMMAAISPSLSDYEETLSTLKFAQSVKKVETRAVVNEANEKGIQQQLKAENERMKDQLSQYEKEKSRDGEELEMLRRRLQEHEDLCTRFGDWDNALALERRRQAQRKAVTRVDLEQLQEKFVEMHRVNMDAKRLAKFGVQDDGNSDSGVSEEWNDLEADSSGDDVRPVLLLRSAEDGKLAGVDLPQKFSPVEQKKLNQGAILASKERAEDLRKSMVRLTDLAKKAESAANSLSPAGAPLIRLLPMVVADPLLSAGRRAEVVVAVVPSCGFSDLFDSDSVDESSPDEDVMEWLAESELCSRLAWLQRQMNARQRAGKEGAWVACRRAVGGGTSSGEPCPDHKDTGARHQAEFVDLQTELAQARQHLEERDAELAAVRRELEFSERARRELVLADVARRELETTDGRQQLEFQPPRREEAPDGDVADIALSFKNALGALDQAQAALQGREPRMVRKGKNHH